MAFGCTCSGQQLTSGWSPCLTSSRTRTTQRQPRPNRAPGAHRSGPSITKAQEGTALRKAALAAAREDLSAAAGDRCHVEPHAEYGGEFVVMWGESHLQVGLRCFGRALRARGWLGERVEWLWVFQRYHVG